MRANKMKGGIVYNFDITTIGKISIEREYNNALNLDKDGIDLMVELNAFAHSLDFKSRNSVFTKSNNYVFLIKEKISDSDNYFANNLKKMLCGNSEFIDFLIDIYSDESINLNFESVDTLSYPKLTDTLKKLTDFILFEDYSDVDGRYTIHMNGVETKTFLRNTKMLYGENYKKAITGGVGSDDESMPYYDIYYSPIVSFNSYETIKGYYAQHITEEYFDNLAVIIGYANMFRFCGLFSHRTKVYESLNNLYHLLRYFPIYEDASVKSDYISHIYKETHSTLIELAKRIYSICTGKKLNKSVLKSRSIKLSDFTKTMENDTRKSARLNKK